MQEKIQMNEGVIGPKLHAAVLSGNIEKVSEFCKSLKTENIESINTLNAEGMAPLHLAIINKNEELFSLLLDTGANPNKLTANGVSCIILAIQSNSINILNRLIDEKADVNLTDINGNAPLKIAMDLKNQEFINLLQEHGAYFSKKINHTNYNTIKVTAATFVESFVTLIQTYSTTDTRLIFRIFADDTTNLLESYIVDLDKSFYSDAMLNEIFNLIVANLNLNTKISKKEILSLSRKIIIKVASYIKCSSLQNKNDVLILLSKAESYIEEAIIKAKRSIEYTHSNTNKDILSLNKFENLKHLDANDENINVNFSKYCQVSSVKLLARKVDRKFDLMDFYTIRPSNFTTTEELHIILKNNNTASTKLDQTLVNKIEQAFNKKNSTQDLLSIDKAIRIGKKSKIHILFFVR